MAPPGVCGAKLGRRARGGGGGSGGCAAGGGGGKAGKGECYEFVDVT